jgi:hypothetical protein
MSAHRLENAAKNTLRGFSLTRIFDSVRLAMTHIPINDCMHSDCILLRQECRDGHVPREVESYT